MSLSPDQRAMLPPHRPDDAPLPRLPGWLGVATDAVFAAGARIRGRRRTLHPRGAAFRGLLTTHPEGRLPRPEVLAGSRRWPVLVRLSKGAGLPPGWPDVLGLAIRLVDAYGQGRHQDLLLSTSGSPPLLRHLVLPAVGFDRAVYSSITPFRSHGRSLLLSATARQLPKHVTLDDLADAATHMRFTLRCAEPLTRWEPVASVVLDEQLPDEEAAELAFDPWNTGADLRPKGLLNQLRAPAYAGSRRGRRASR